MTQIDLQLITDIVRAASARMDRTGGFEIHDKGEPVLGVVYSPWRGELYTAEKSKGFIPLLQRYHL